MHFLVQGLVHFPEYYILQDFASPALSWELKESVVNAHFIRDPTNAIVLNPQSHSAFFWKRCTSLPAVHLIFNPENSLPLSTQIFLEYIKQY